MGPRDRRGAVGGGGAGWRGRGAARAPPCISGDPDSSAHDPSPPPRRRREGPWTIRAAGSAPPRGASSPRGSSRGRGGEAPVYLCPAHGPASTRPHRRRCVRCHTRYCDAACQHEHWANGHKKKCKKIARGGGAEQFYADKKAEEAADEAVAACAAQGVPQDAECFICKCSIEGTGIVRGCACRGSMGLAHVSCLVRQADMAVKEWEESERGMGIEQWSRCFQCKRRYTGSLQLALGWGCWKTYLSQPEGVPTARGVDLRGHAMNELANGLDNSRNHQEALPVYEALIAMIKRTQPANSPYLLMMQANMADCLHKGGDRCEEAIDLMRSVYFHPCGYSADRSRRCRGCDVGSRRSRGCDVDIPWRRVAHTAAATWKLGRDRRTPQVRTDPVRAWTEGPEHDSHSLSTCPDAE